MLPILFTALVLIGVMGAWPETRLARSLRRWLIDTPARALSRFSHRRLIGPALLAGVGAVLFLLFEAEGLRLFALAAPELVGWAVMFDLTVALDVVAAGLTLVAAARLKPVMMQARRVASRLAALPRRAARGLRTRMIRRPGPRRSDDPEPVAAYALA